MTAFLLVGAGGAVGSIARYAVGLAVHPTAFPYATLIVNVIGCLGIGLALPTLERASAVSPEFRQLVIVGLLGGFTTFSAFGGETLALMRTGVWPALLNVMLNVACGLAAVAIGRLIGASWG